MITFLGIGVYSKVRMSASPLVGSPEESLEIWVILSDFPTFGLFFHSDPFLHEIMISAWRIAGHQFRDKAGHEKLGTDDHNCYSYKK